MCKSTAYVLGCCSTGCTPSAIQDQTALRTTCLEYLTGAPRTTSWDLIKHNSLGRFTATPLYFPHRGTTWASSRRAHPRRVWLFITASQQLTRSQESIKRLQVPPFLQGQVGPVTWCALRSPTAPRPQSTTT